MSATRHIGFEASLRAAIAPFPTARAVALTVRNSSEDGELDGSPLLPVAQELVLNAVKHAAPAAIEVTVETRDQQLVLEVNDDGVGIDTARSPRPRRRVEDAVGAFEIETRADGRSARA